MDILNKLALFNIIHQCNNIAQFNKYSRCVWYLVEEVGIFKNICYLCKREQKECMLI